MADQIQIHFDRVDLDGSVEVEVAVNEDPAVLGCPEYARGFPYCRTTVTPPARGYLDALGWVQLVSSTDLADEFRIDPFESLGEVSHPFCFFGFAPTLFDAPHREQRRNTDWIAHSFLCGLGEEPLEGAAQADAILGFSWGFSIRDSRIDIDGPPVLSPDDWDRHHAHLQRAHPRWSFIPCLSEDPPRR